MATIPSTPGGTVSAGILFGSPREVVGPDDAGEVGRVELRQLLEEVQWIEKDADHVVERVEVVYADETSGLLLVVVEVLMPRPMVDDDQIACLPGIFDAVDLAVPPA